MKKLTHMTTYLSSQPTVGQPEGQANEVTPYDQSPLSLPHPLTEPFLGWRWFNWRRDRFIYTLLDLRNDTYVDHVTVRLDIPPESVRQSDYQRVLLSARTEADPRYRVTARFLKQDEPEDQTGKNQNRTVIMELPVKRTVRCLNLEFQRGEWWELPMPFIEVFGEEPTELHSPYTAEQMEKEWHNEAMVVDVYGQATYIDYPGKITCDEDLRRDAAREREALKDVTLDTDRYDSFGGWKTGKNYGATGFFRVEKVDGVWWFISPEGNLFFLKGIDGVGYDEMSHYTPIYQPGTDIQRGAFEALPDRERCPEAYKMFGGTVPVIDFQQANLRIKYGENYRQEWADVTMKRLTDWGFNASGKWYMEPELHHRLPRIECVRDNGDLICTKSGWDPWDPAFEEKLSRAFDQQLTPLKDDPYIIGYHFQNEDGWELDDLRRILHTQNHEFPAKAAFVDFMKERYQGDLRVVNVVLGTEASSFEELVTTDLNMDALPPKDRDLFMEKSSHRFHRILRDTFRKYDPNHLFFGCTPVLNWRSCPEWNAVYAEYVDVLAIDWYFSLSADWMRNYLYADKPMINIEFGYVTCDRGHGPFFSSMTCRTQEERAWRYDTYVRNQAKVPQFVGIGYFIYSDQEIAGRSGPDGSWGECFQFGLVSTQDQPYETFVQQIKKTNAHLEELHRDGAPQDYSTKSHSPSDGLVY